MYNDFHYNMQKRYIIISRCDFFVGSRLANVEGFQKKIMGSLRFLGNSNFFTQRRSNVATGDKY